MVPAAFLTLFFVVPVTTLLADHLRIGAILDVVGDGSLRGVAWFSLWQGVVSTALTLAIGLPATWAVTRWQFPGSGILASTMTIPFLMPAVVMATGVAALLPSRGIPAILWAHVAFNLSVVLRVVGPTWALLDHSLEESAASLGASGWKVFRAVTWPAIRESVQNAASLVFVFCATSFAVVSILGGATVRTIESEVFTRAVRLGDLRTATALAMIQAVAVLAVLGLGRTRESEVTSRESPERRRLSSRIRMRWLPPAVAGVGAIVACAPLLAVAVRSLRYGGDWNLAGWRALGDGTLHRIGLDAGAIARMTLVFASACALITVVLALLACGHPRRSIVEQASFAPLFMSSVTLGLGIIVAFDSAPLDWRGRTWLIPLVHSVIALPLAVRVIGPALRGIDGELAVMAADLGAGPVRRWWTVTLPLLVPAIGRAAAISAAVSIGEFGATSFLARSGSTTISIAIGNLMGRPGPLLQQMAFALSTLSWIVILLMSVVRWRGGGRQEEYRLRAAILTRSWTR